jgi:hypothetical protein
MPNAASRHECAHGCDRARFLRPFHGQLTLLDRAGGGDDDSSSTGPTQKAAAAGGGVSAKSEMDDAIPFAPAWA